MFILGSAAIVAACGSDDSQATSGVEEPGIDGPDGVDGKAPTDGATGDGAVSIDPTQKEAGAKDASIDASTDAMLDAGADADADAGDPDPPPPPVITYKHYDINHVLSTGASDSVANGGTPVLTSTQPLGNQSFDVGVFTASGCNADGCTGYQTPGGFTGLKEGDSFFSGSPRETMASGFANQATTFATKYFNDVGVVEPQHDILVSAHGRSGNPYWCLRLQTANVAATSYPCYKPKTENLKASFDEALLQVQAAKTFADNQAKSYVVRAVTYIGGQGESDDNEASFAFLVSTDGANRRLLNYTDGLFDFQWDYDNKVKAITGQAEDIPMFISQFGSMTPSKTPLFSIIPQRQLDAHTSSNGKINLVAPNYPFTHYSDCLHYSSHSQRRLGAYFAKAYQKVVIEGGKWEPTRPLSVTRAGNVITVQYVVPVPPLVIDTTRIAAPIAANFDIVPVQGFVYRDSTNSAKVTNVVCHGPRTR